MTTPTPTPTAPDAVRIDELARTLADIFGQEWGGVSGEPSLDWDDDQISEDDREMWRTVVSRFIAAAGFTIAEPGQVAVSRDTLTRMYRDFDQRAIMGDDSTINREVREWIESILDPALSAGAGPDGEGE